MKSVLFLVLLSMGCKEWGQYSHFISPCHEPGGPPIGVHFAEDLNWPREILDQSFATWQTVGIVFDRNIKPTSVYIEVLHDQEASELKWPQGVQYGNLIKLNPSYFDSGTFAHELGHYLGIKHHEPQVEGCHLFNAVICPNMTEFTDLDLQAIANNKTCDAVKAANAANHL